MKPIFFRCTITILLYLLTVNPLWPVELVHTVTFDLATLRIDQLAGYDRVLLPDCEVSYQVGAPQLPVRPLQLVLPVGANVTKIDILTTESNLLPGHYHIYPVQPPRVISLADNQQIAIVEPDKKIYESGHAFPDALIEFVSSGNVAGYNIGHFIVYPVQYLPVEKKLRCYSRIEFSIHYETGSGGEALIEMQSSDRVQEWVNKLAANKTEVKNMAWSTDRLNVNLQPGHYAYIIITDSVHAPYFEPLCQWKTQKGVPARIITTEWLRENYAIAGADLQVIMRTFLQDAVREWGTIWVLLGGDTNILKERTAYAMDCEVGSADMNAIPCDLYFSDLDGTWDANGNKIYGEVEDEIDMMPDVFVGRASCNNAQEILSFVEKILTYEKRPDLDYLERILFAADILWDNPYTNTGEAKDMIDEKYVPDFFQIIKLYDHLHNESPQSVVAAINQGVGFINHDGHGSPTYLGVGSGGLRNWDMDQLSNKDKYSVLFSIACLPASFEQDCIAEHFITNPAGGGVAFIGNSRYGWGSPGNPGYGYSDRYDDALFDFIHKHGVTNVGAAIGLAKARYVPYAQQENVYRWCMYEINLLGDPEMPIWTSKPKPLVVTYPDSLPLGAAGFTVTVTDGVMPVPAARVCIMNGDDIYQFAHTGLDGQVQFDIHSTNPALPLTVTTVAQNFLPDEGEIFFVTGAPYLAVNHVILDDANSSYVDGHLNPGETMRLRVELKNYGSASLENVTATLTCQDASVTLIDSVVDYGTIDGQSQLTPVTDAFSFSVNSTPKNGHSLVFDIVMTAAGPMQWQAPLAITVATPYLEYLGFNRLDTPDGNGVPEIEPGETVRLVTAFKNNGLTLVLHLDCTITSLDPYVKIGPAEEHRLFENLAIMPDSVFSIPFTVAIDQNCPNPHFAKICVQSRCSQELIFQDTILVTIGSVGLAEDCETGATGWSHSGTKDLWHLSGNRYHSESRSWYASDPNLNNYPTLMNAVLASPTFYTPHNAVLSFWAWYDVALYSAWNFEGDGLHVEVYHDDRWQQLDFIGTGGALQPVLMGNDWLEYRYDLSHIPPGSQTQVRFRFVSDNDNEKFEGTYIDDISVVTGSHPVSIDTSLMVPVGNARTEAPKQFELSQNYPNPFAISLNSLFGNSTRTTIRYQVPEGRQQLVSLKIYNILGQEIKTLVSRSLPAGIHTVHWDGRDNQGNLVSVGVYFYKIKAGNFENTRKMLILR